MNKEFVRKLWGIMNQKYKKTLILLMLLAVLIESLKLLAPYIFKMVIDEIVGFSNEKIEYIVFLVVLMFLSSFIVNFIRFLLNRSANRFLSEFENYIALKLQKKLISLPISYHEQEDTGNKVTKIQRGIDKTTHIMIMMIWDIFPNLIQVFITLMVLFFVNFYLGIVFLFTSPVFIYVSWVMNNKAKSKRDQINLDYEDASGLLAQSIINIFSVQSFSQENKEYKRFKKIRKRLAENAIDLWVGLYAKYSLYKDVLIDFGRVLIILIGVFLISKGMITIGTLVFAVTLTEKAYSSLHHFAFVYDRFSESATTVERL